VEDVRQQGAADEEELGDIPDDFLGNTSCDYAVNSDLVAAPTHGSI
jgi:hypothetical protein